VIGLDALEYWSKVMPTAVMPHLHAILPYLSDYLSIDSRQYEQKLELEREFGLYKSAVKYKTRNKSKATKTLEKVCNSCETTPCAWLAHHD
jgi:predicted nucleic acid binding AN1-type Zn finger protein